MVHSKQLVIRCCVSQPAAILLSTQVRIVKDDVHREEYAAQHFEWVSQQQLGQHLSATAGRTIILGDHHALYMDGLNLHCCIRDAIRSTGTSAGAITVVGRGTADDPLFSRACNPKQHLMMHKGRKLSGIVKAWRDINSKYRPRPLIVYPQVRAKAVTPYPACDRHSQARTLRCLL
eukprot:jgi/Chrzof1/8217/Cz03g01260.t1